MMGGFIMYPSALGLLFLILVLSLANENQGQSQSACPNLDSIYQFGDSISDTGNLVREPVLGALLSATRLPYGETYGRPTGRWCDGLIFIDYFALAVGLPLLNPYLDKSADFSHGVNFAVAAATAADFVSLAARGIVVPPIAPPLGGQIDWFKEHLSSICSSPTECSEKLARSLVFLGEIGGDDVNFALVGGKSFEQTRTYIPFITETIINYAREVIRLGATRIVFPGNLPIGCFPVALSRVTNASPEEFDELGCARRYNDLVTYQNDYLQKALASLRTEFPNVSLVYADIYGAIISILTRASDLGFDTGGSILKVCCGVGGEYNFNNITSCGNPGVPVCPNPNRYIHWDGIHPTQEAYRRISEILIPSILPQINCS